jgi:hypothetical protein
MHDASLPSTTTYSLEGENPTAIEIHHKDEISLKLLHRLSGRGTVFTPFQSRPNPVQSHERRNQGSQGRQQDAVEFGVSCGTDPLLPERVLPDRGTPTVGAHKVGIQSHIILVVWAIGATSSCMVTVKHTLFYRERQVADKILSDSDRS